MDVLHTVAEVQEGAEYSTKGWQRGEDGSIVDIEVKREVGKEVGSASVVEFVGNVSVGMSVDPKKKLKPHKDTQQND